MFKLKRSMYIEAAHLLKGHPGYCKYIHGHSYKITVVISSCALVDDMVVDFGLLKEIMNEVIGKFDHTIIVDKRSINKAMDHTRMIVMENRPTAERMAEHFYYKIRNELYKLKINILLNKVTVRETENNEACYSQPFKAALD